MSTFNGDGGDAGTPEDGPGPKDDDTVDNATPGTVEDDGERRGPKLPVYSTSPRRLWVPIVICIVGAGLLSICLNVGRALVPDQPEYEIADPSLGPGAYLIDAVIFIGIGAVAAFILIKIVRKRGINALEKIMTFAFLVLGTFITYFYGLYLLVILSQYIYVDGAWTYIWWAPSFAIALGLVWLYASPKYANRQGIHNIVVVIFGVLIGSYLTFLIGTWTSLIILMGFSLYDIYSVRKGPIKEMMQQADPDVASGDLTDVGIDDISLDIGIGDLAFYSMLTSITLISAEWGGPGLVAVSRIPFLYIVPFAAAVVGVLIGAWISFELVKKNKILPGLPMSIFIGIGLYSLAIGICLLFILM